MGGCVTQRPPYRHSQTTLLGIQRHSKTTLWRHSKTTLAGYLSGVPGKIPRDAR